VDIPPPLLVSDLKLGCLGLLGTLIRRVGVMPAGAPLL
jgi:hypothetical protein